MNKDRADFFKRGDIRGYVSRSWSVSWPMTVIMSFEFLIGLTDVFIAGRISKEVQAAYGFVIQFYFILIVVANAFTVGTVSVVARLFTSKDEEALTSTVFSSAAFATVAGVVLALGGIFLSPTVISFLNIPEEIKQFAIPLTRIYAAGLLFHYVLINSNGILRSCNRVKKSLQTMAVVCAINIGLNFFLVFYAGLGFRGIATATASSVFVGCMINMVRIRRIMTGVKEYSWDAVKKMTQIGWPIGLLQVLWQLSSMVLFLILSALPEHKVEILAALTTGLRIESAIFLPIFGFNMANAVIVGNLLGEKKEKEALRSGMVTAGVGVSIVAVMIVVVIANAHWIAASLSKNEIVVRESVRYIYISMISEPFMAWGVILSGGLSGAGDTRSVLLRIAFSVWLVRIPLSYICVAVFGFGPVFVWWSMNLSQLVQSFLISKRYFSKKWVKDN